MNIQQLKTKLVDEKFNKDVDLPLIFLCKHGTLVAEQYYNKIVELTQLELNYMESLNDYILPTVFCGEVLNIYKTDDLKMGSIFLKDNFIAICKNIDKETKEKYKDCIIEVPKLEEWQLKEFITSKTNLPVESATTLLSLCKNDPELVNTEINRLCLFSDDQREKLFQKYLNDGTYNHLNPYTNYDLSNAVIRHNIIEVAKIYKYINQLDIDPLGFLSLLLKGFKDVIDVQLGNHPNAATLGMTPAQFYVIKNFNINYYNKIQLINIYKFLSNLDKELKTGCLDLDNLITYIIINVFSF